MFQRICMETWNRANMFSHFSADCPCTYSITVNLNITRLLQEIKKHQLKFFPTFLYGLSVMVNRHSEFRMDKDQEGYIGFYDSCNPYYTVFHPETETFTNVWTQMENDIHLFFRNYTEDMHCYQNNVYESKKLEMENIFYVSCIPWTSFTSFHLDLQNEHKCYQPIFTIGKYFTQNNISYLPLAIQVHHAVCDGYHVGRFVNELQEWLDTFSL